MTKRVRILITWGALAGLAACSGGDDEAGGWGCDKSADSDACIEYSGSQWSGSQRPEYEQACTDDSGTVVDACPTDGVAGECLSFADTPTENTQVYYTGANVMLAEQVCTFTGGSWSP